MVGEIRRATTIEFCD